jgi:ABC-type branched-subunit amino acid transport system permease subunit
MGNATQIALFVFYVLGSFAVGYLARHDYDQERRLIRTPWLILAAAYFWPLMVLPLLVLPLLRGRR